MQQNSTHKPQQGAGSTQNCQPPRVVLDSWIAKPTLETSEQQQATALNNKLDIEDNTKGGSLQEQEQQRSSTSNTLGIEVYVTRAFSGTRRKQHKYAQTTTLPNGSTAPCKR